ncbi:hypothetical protein EDB84DRAFT_798741 [Lactarius hengduanensis]|nr:hypothetical protein EDB84DRAFT_798741 [Lactarius hengduanensis]
MTHFVFVLLLAFYLFRSQSLARPTAHILVGAQNFSDLGRQQPHLQYYLFLDFTILRLARDRDDRCPALWVSQPNLFHIHRPFPVAPLIQSRPFLEGECKAEGLEGRGVLKAVVVIP